MQKNVSQENKTLVDVMEHKTLVDIMEQSISARKEEKNRELEIRANELKQQEHFHNLLLQQQQHFQQQQMQPAATASHEYGNAEYTGRNNEKCQ